MKLDRTELDHLYRYCLSLCGHADDAFDLLQDAVEKYLNRSGLPVAEPLAYLKRIARNHFYDQLRRRQRMPLEVLENEDQIADVEKNLESMVIDQRLLVQVWKLLTPGEREVVFLWAAEGLTAKEIAVQLELPRATVLSRLHRLRTRINSTSSFASTGGGYVN